MRRRARLEEPGAIHHVFARGNNKAPIFLCDDDRVAYLRMLGEQMRASSWNVLAYCLMGNHVHLLVETPQPNLAEGMWGLHRGYARAVHGRAGRIGHMFNERYGSSRVFDDARLRGLLAYLALNPVEAGFCAEPEDWRWSSYARLLAAPGQAPVAWPRLAELVGCDVADLIALHRSCIEAVRLVGAPEVPGHISPGQS